MLARTVATVLLIASVAGCQGKEPAKTGPTGPTDPTEALAWPRVALHMSGGHERASWDLTLDATGKYGFESAGDDGGGTIHWSVCTGQVAQASVTPLFEAFEAAALNPSPDGYALPRDQPRPDASIVNERLWVSLRTAPGDEKVPAGLETYERLRDRGGAFLDRYLADRPASERCEKGVRKP